jgi:DNA-binding CsgD family transcriptional regulator
MGRPNKALLIGEADRLHLRALVRSRSMPHSLVRRARIVLLSGEGQSNREVARRCGVSAPAVSHGRAAIRSADLLVCTTNCGRGARARMTMRRWRN